MIFTVIDERGRKQTYDGFTHFSGGPIPIRLGITAACGDTEFWVLDPANVKQGVEELKRYLRMTWGSDVNDSVQVFEHRPDLSFHDSLVYEPTEE